MAPVYSWYQQDEKPSPAVEMEPNSEGKFPTEQVNRNYTFLALFEIVANWIIQWRENSTGNLFLLPLIP